MANLLITGASGGLGMAVIPRLLQDGWTLSIAAHTHASMQQIRERFPESSLQIHLVDITRREQIRQWVMDSGEIAGLVHLAGGFRGGTRLADATEDDFQFLFDLHAKATFHLLAELMPVLIQRRDGAIVTVAARTAIKPGKDAALYAASKAAELTLTLAAAEEGRPYQVRANCILPAIIRTPTNMQGASATDIAKWTPPEDIAELIAFLVSHRARSITGTTFPMYGGLPA
ncbi:MAG: SDR family NAD(P)-dependent oxidoreductase [Thermoflavifilum sp.]|nr:SDR family NAD(P)-dependent oxidoreductase [Thermoflavifilum sp.]